ncbi:MAG TPA: DoxX family protein [Gammaproteobacteria bacterium]|nr:DoxX family protein [Gammaproteobacteria bacterium]
MRIASVGHGMFAAIMIALGIFGLIEGGFAPIWDGVPKALPAREALAYLCAIIALACGIGLLWKRTGALAARTLFAYLLVWILLVKGRFILHDPLTEVNYESTGETAVSLAAAWVLYAWFATDWDRKRLGFAVGDKGVRNARVVYGLALIAFGLSHFAYLDNTASLVPGWLPWHVFWTSLTGTAYLAAGVAILIGVYARLAATLAALQIGLFGLLVWVPRLGAAHFGDDTWGEFGVSCALLAGAWVIADSYRSTPWLAIGKARTSGSGSSP